MANGDGFESEAKFRAVIDPGSLREARQTVQEELGDPAIPVDVRRSATDGGGVPGSVGAATGGADQLDLARDRNELLAELLETIEQAAFDAAQGGGGGGGGGGGLLGALGPGRAGAALGGLGGLGAAGALALPLALLGLAGTISPRENRQALQRRGGAQERMSFLGPGAGLPGPGTGAGNRFFLTDQQARQQMQQERPFDRELFQAANRRVMERERQFDRELFGAANRAQGGGSGQTVVNVEVPIDMTGRPGDVTLTDQILDRITREVTRNIEGKLGGRPGGTGLRMTSQ